MQDDCQQPDDADEDSCLRKAQRAETDNATAAEDEEQYGTNYGSPLNIYGGGRLAVTGGELRAAGDRPISQSASLTISGGLVDFDGHQIDFDEAIARAGTYRDFERKAREEACNLFREVR